MLRFTNPWDEEWNPEMSDEPVAEPFERLEQEMRAKDWEPEKLNKALAAMQMLRDYLMGTGQTEESECEDDGTDPDHDNALNALERED